MVGLRGAVELGVEETPSLRLELAGSAGGLPREVLRYAGPLAQQAIEAWAERSTAALPRLAYAGRTTRPVAS